MGNYYLGHDPHKVFFQMYKGRACGISFPTDGNKHNEEWKSINLPLNPPIHIRHYADGTVIAIEVDLPDHITEFGAAIE